MEKTKLGNWVGEWVEVRVLGPTGGFQTAGICDWTDKGNTLVGIGDAILTPDTEGEIVEGGVIRVDWTTIGTLMMLQDMTQDMQDNPDDADEDDVIFEAGGDELMEWLEQFKPEEEEDDDDDFTI